MSVSLAKRTPATIATVPTVVHTVTGESMRAMNDVLANNHLDAFPSVLRAINMDSFTIESRVSLKKESTSDWQDNHPVVWDNYLGRVDHAYGDMLRKNNLFTLFDAFRDMQGGRIEIH